MCSVIREENGSCDSASANIEIQEKPIWAPRRDVHQEQKISQKYFPIADLAIVLNFIQKITDQLQWKSKAVAEHKFKALKGTTLFTAPSSVIQVHKINIYSDMNDRECQFDEALMWCNFWSPIDWKVANVMMNFYMHFRSCKIERKWGLKFSHEHLKISIILTLRKK